MPTLSVDDFMAAQSAPAKAKRAAAPPAGVMSVDDFMAHQTSSKPMASRAPDWTDDVKASARFLGNEVLGVGQALNPYNIAQGLINTVAHPIDTAKALINTPSRMYEQYQNGDMDGLAQGIGNIAGTVIGAKVAPEVPGMAQNVAGRLGGAIDAASPYAKALAPIAGKGVMAAAKELPVVGSVIKSGGKILDAAQEAKAAIDEVNGKAPATKPVTTKVSTPTASEVSSKAATNALGTKPGVTVTESAGKGARTVDALDAETTQALVDAHKNGELAKLPAEARKDLTTAVKNGDSAGVAKVLDGHGATKGVFKAVEDKVNVLTKYVQDHNIDLSQYTTPADRQVLADAAYGHGVKNGLPVPKSGRYRGVSDDTWKMVQDRLAGN